MAKVVVEKYHGSDYKLVDSNIIYEGPCAESALRYFYGVQKIIFHVKWKDTYFLVDTKKNIFKYKIE